MRVPVCEQGSVCAYVCVGGEHTCVNGGACACGWEGSEDIGAEVGRRVSTWLPSANYPSKYRGKYGVSFTRLK